MTDGTGFISGKVERLYLIPGFGSVMRGWALHNLHFPAEYALAVDEGAISTPAEELLMFDRPDIRQALNLPQDLYRTPGFIAVFPDPASVSKPASQCVITYPGGAMVTLPIDSATVTLLGHSASADALLTACPRLPFANRWSDLRKGALRHLARAGAESTAIHLEPVEKAIFLACPSDPSGQFLLLDALSQADLGGAGIVLFVEPEAWTPELARGINTVSVPNRVKVSVISINDTQQSLLTLPLIAKALKCRRAAFLGADVYADAGALSELAGTLTRSGEGLQVYPVHDPATGRSDRAAVALSAPVSLLDRAISALTPRLLASHYRFPDDDVQSPDTPAFQLVQRRVLTASENWIQNG